MVDQEIRTPDFANLSELQAMDRSIPSQEAGVGPQRAPPERNWEHDSMISSSITNFSSFASESRQIPPRAPRSIQNKSKKT